MGETTISWTTGPNGEQGYTFNPWIGCARVGPGCDNCYAADLMGTEGRHKRAQWGGPGVGAGTRVRTKTWGDPVKWNRQAAAAGERRLVFCASLADVFDNEVPTEWRRDLFAMIHETPNLTWLLLTKRPGNIEKMVREMVEADQGPYCDPQGVRAWWPPNAAIGCSVVNQEEADRDVPKLLEAKKNLRPAFAFLSLEPLLGPIDLTRISTLKYRGAEVLNALTGTLSGLFGDYCPTRLPPVDWVITGGESGPRARIMDPRWVRSILSQCYAHLTPLHHKQNGEFVAGIGTAGGWIYPINGEAESVVWSLRRSVDLGEGWFADRVGLKRAGRMIDGAIHAAPAPLPTETPL